ncbi:MAG: hypothetical protein AAF847_16895 [Bacteroidota bacterium]
MKNRNTRSTLLVLLVCASISSAVYLNIVSTDEEETSLPSIELPAQESFEDQDSRSLPDVDLLKKVLGVSNKILAAIGN